MSPHVDAIGYKAPDRPSRVRLTYHEMSEGWDRARLNVPAWASQEGFRGEESELAAVLRRRGVVPRRQRTSISAREVYEALSGLPQKMCSTLVWIRRTVSSADLHSPRSILTVPGRVEVLARSHVVAAVVAAAHTTRRPMLALTALASRLLMEGRAVLRELAAKKE